MQPTRSELQEVNRKINLTRNGHRILKLKRDGLILEFFKILDEAKDIRDELVRKYIDSSERIAIADAVDGVLAVRSAALAISKEPKIELLTRNLMGVVVPEIETTTIRTPPEDRGYGILGTSPHIDLATDSYQKLVETIVKAAELETTMRRLLDEIERTKRRVNALEFKVLPDLIDTKRFIEMRLEEMERDNIFRLKRIKAKAKEA
ncbi:MAG: V-type ATP synthase subunit D [Thermoplasmata archaeon]